MANSATLQFPISTEGSTTAGADINECIARTGVFHAVNDRVTSLPGSPSEGDAYLISASAGSHPNEIATYANGGWVYITPTAGMRISLAGSTAQSRLIYYDTAWQWLEKRWDSYTSISSGTHTLNFAEGNLAFYTLSAAGTYTAAQPAKALVPGVEYMVVYRNTSGSSATISYPSSNGWTGYDSAISLPASSYVYVRLTAGTSRMNVLTAGNAGALV